MSRHGVRKLGFGIKLSVLDNGLNVITKEIAGNLCWSGLAVRSGSAYDPPEHSGLAHVIEHCVFDGIKADAIKGQAEMCLTSDHEMNWVVEGRGATMNGLNSYGTVTYVIDHNVRDVLFMLSVLLKVVSFPKLADRSVAQQKSIVGAELDRDMENPLYGDKGDTYFDLLLRSHLFSVNPVRNMNGGTIEGVSRITPKMVRETFGAFYGLNNMLLIVVGDVDHGSIVRIAEKVLGPYAEMLPPPVKIPKISDFKEKRLSGAEIHTWTSDHFKHAVVNMGYRAPTALGRDRAAIRILSAVLGEFTHSRLYKEFRERRGVAYFAESRYGRNSIYGELVAHVNLHPFKNGETIKSLVDDVREFVAEQVKRIASGEISDEEFNQARVALYNHDRRFGLEDGEYVRGILVDAFGNNKFDSGSISASIRRELNSALRVRNCQKKTFVSAVERQIDPEKYVLLVSGPTGCYE